MVRQLQNAEGKRAEGGENGLDLLRHLRLRRLCRWVEIQRLGRHVCASANATVLTAFLFYLLHVRLVKVTHHFCLKAQHVLSVRPSIGEYNGLHVRHLLHRLGQRLQLRDDTLHVPNRNDPLVRLDRLHFVHWRLLLDITSTPQRNLLHIVGFRGSIPALLALYLPFSDIQKRNLIYPIASFARILPF